MSTFLLIRHGSIPTLGTTIAGWMPGIHLTEDGEREVMDLADRLAPLPIGALYSSPLERTRETAAILGERIEREVRILDDLGEVRLGDWTGRTFDEVRLEPEWRTWSSFRSGSRAPGGEYIIEVQARVVQRMLQLRQEHENDVVLLVTHGDVIRSALAWFLGVPVDLFKRIAVHPASVSTIALRAWGPEILGVNQTSGSPRLEMA